MPSLVEKLLRIPQPEDLIWNVARQNMEKSGGKDLLLGLALELRKQGDDSAIVGESTKKWSPYQSFLTLRWNLEPSGAVPLRWVSKGIQIVARHNGEVRVELTYYKKDWGRWLSLDEIRHLSLKESPQNLEEMSLEEKVRFAMSIAGRIMDYRYGSPVFKSESKAWQTIFP